MKKILFIASLLILLVSPMFAQNIYHSSEYYDLQSLVINNSLPPISGVWYFVDPYLGDSTRDGLSIASSVNRFDTAYARCKDGYGDGICFISPRSTSTQTTCYLTVPMVWSKNGITVVGVCAPTRQFIRARVANKEVTTGSVATLSFVDGGTGYDYIYDSGGNWIKKGFTVGQKLRVATNSTTNNGTSWVVDSVTATKLFVPTASVTAHATESAATVENYMDYVIKVSGDNNYFKNIHIGNYDADALAVGGVIVSGNRNVFENCDIMGACGATAAATHRSLELYGAQDNTFIHCTIGNDMIERGNYASCEILFTINDVKSCERNRFEGCELQCYVSSGNSHGAIGMSGATACRRDHVFKDCIFRANTAAQSLAFIGTAQTAGIFYMINTFACNYTAWATGADNYVYISAPAAVASGGGGLVVVGTTP